jgi:hypothetical protein
VLLAAMLQHVFDRSPDDLAIPWGYLGELAGRPSSRRHLLRYSRRGDCAGFH